MRSLNTLYPLQKRLQARSLQRPCCALQNLMNPQKTSQPSQRPQSQIHNRKLPTPAGKPAPGAALEKSTAELAAMEGVSERTIRQAKAVHANATPEVKAAVKAGTMSVKKAAETIKPAKPKKERPTPAPAIEQQKSEAPDEGAPDDAEMESLRIQEEAEQKTMQFLLASNEPLADLAAKNTQLEAQIKQLNLRIAGLMNSNTEYIQTIKRLQAQIKKVQA
jgi:hypothetical protein